MTHPLLDGVRIAGRELNNRIAVAPMSRVSTAGDGVPTAAMAEYFATYARGGFGLIISDGTYTDHAYAQAYPDQPALVTDEQVEAWARVVDAVHAEGGVMVAQLMHAGALTQGNRHRSGSIAPSVVTPKGRMLRGYGGGGPYAVPRAATHDDLAEVLDGIAAAARNARLAGFDGIEVHAANGYLFDQFLTRYTNLREDGYGGTATNRARLTVEAIDAARAGAGGALVVGVRVSQAKVNDVAYRWDGVEEAREIFSAIAAARPDYVHVASEGAPWRETSFLAPGVTITGVAREVVGVPVIANGGMHDLELASMVLRDGHADLVSLGHAAIANPDWPQRLAAGTPFDDFDPGMLTPEVTIANTDRWRAEAALAGASRVA